MAGRGRAILRQEGAHGLMKAQRRRTKSSRKEEEARSRLSKTGSHSHPEIPPYVSNLEDRRLRLYVPSPLSFVLRAHLGQFCPEVHDAYRWVVSSVIYLTLAVRSGDQHGFVRLHWETLGSVIGRHMVTKVMGDLLAWRVLERSPGYHVGKRSLGYRLHSSIGTAKVRLDWIKDPKLAARVWRNLEKQEVALSNLDQAYQLVNGSVKRVRINGLKARWATYKAHGARSAACVARRISIDALENGNCYFLVEPRSKRAYHNVCNLAADLRRFLTIDKEPLGQVDIANSQPFFLWLQFAPEGSVDRGELALMLTSLLKGSFYEEFNIKGKPREEFKKEFFRDVLYGKGHYTTATTELFRQRYPSFDQAIRASKRGDHTQLPIAMQRLEAKVIFTAVERFHIRTKGQVPILTIHDSLVTTIRHLELAKQVLLEVFQEMHGIQPLLRVKSFADDRRRSA